MSRLAMAVIFSSIGAMLIPNHGYAHPEHAGAQDSTHLVHFLTDPYHLGVAGVVLVTGLLALRMVGWGGAKGRARAKR